MQIDTEYIILVLTVVFSAGGLFWRVRALEKCVKNGLTEKVNETTTALHILVADVKAINERCAAHRVDIEEARGRMNRLDERIVRTNERVDVNCEQIAKKADRK